MAATRGRTLNVKPNPAPDASGGSRALHDQGEEPWIRAGRTSGRSSAPPAVGPGRRPATGRRLHRRQERNLPLSEDRAERGSDSGACRTAAPRRPGAHAGLRVDDDLRAESERQRVGDPHRLDPLARRATGRNDVNDVLSAVLAGVLAGPVVDSATSVDDQVVVLVAGPDSDLVAVGVDGCGGVPHGRVHQHSYDLVGVVAYSVRARRPGLEADDVPRRELAGSFWMTQGRSSSKDEQPLFLPVLVVIGADRLPRRELVDTCSELLGADTLAEAEHTRSKTVGIILVVDELRLADVDALHTPKIPRIRCNE